MFAIFFPQFCTSDINSEVWGHSFTDWTLIQYANLKNLWPRRMPLRGAYDLSNNSTIESILTEIKDSSLEGIGLYSYYFSHGHELNSVEDHLLANNQQLHLPYFLIWANEPWTKRWIGSNEVIADLSFLDDKKCIKAHCQYLSRHFNNPGYKKTSCGRPIFCLYEPFSVNSKGRSVIDLYRECFNEINEEPFIICFVKRPQDFIYSKLFDGAYVFMPRYLFSSTSTFYSLIPMWLKKLHYLWDFLLKSIFYFQKPKVFSFAYYLKFIKSRRYARFLSSFSVPSSTVRTCGWNNLPRYGQHRYTMLEVPSPTELKEQEKVLSLQDNIFNCHEQHQLFPSLINAWNEWSEGAAIEPCFYLKSSLIDNSIT